MTGKPSPLVSVVIPVRNEAAFIRELLTALLAQDYPGECVELIVTDGMSIDGTRAILEEMARQHPRVKVVDNPGRIVSTGLNAAIAICRGDVVIRIDGHSLPAVDFISQNVALLDEHPEAWEVGGPIRNSARTTFGKAVAIAMAQPLGVGNACHRYPNYEGYSDSTAFPAVRRWVFDRVGMFDVNLIRNQDDEFNYRVTKAGGRVFVSPRVRYTYYVRERLTQLFRQYFQYGFWRVPVMKKHHRPTTLRQVMPTAFYAACALMIAIGASLGEPVLALALPAVYGTALAAAAAMAMPQAGVRVAVLVPVAIAAMHAGYALGLASGGAAALLHRNAWTRSGAMATLSR